MWPLSLSDLELRHLQVVPDTAEAVVTDLPAVCPSGPLVEGAPPPVVSVIHLSGEPLTTVMGATGKDLDSVTGWASCSSGPFMPMGGPSPQPGPGELCGRDSLSTPPSHRPSDQMLAEGAVVSH